MYRAFITLLLISFLTAGSYATEIVEIPLPELHGLYSPEDTMTRYASFQLERSPITIYRLRIRLSGSVNVGQLMCEVTPSPFLQPAPWPMDFLASMRDSITDGRFFGGEITPMESGSFQMTIPFKSFGGATWEFLKSGRGDVELQGIPCGYILICMGIEEPDAVVEEAALIIEADFPISTDSETWSSVKTLFTPKK